MLKPSELKSPISILLGIENGIITFKALICIESAYPSPLVSTVNKHFFGGKIFLINTFNADRSSGIEFHLSLVMNFDLILRI